MSNFGYGPEDKPVRYEFSKRDDDQNESISLSFDMGPDTSWPELVEFFNRFLCACGYIPKKYNNFVVPIDEKEDDLPF